MHIHLRNNPATFRPDPIWNGWDLGFTLQQEQEEQDEQQ